MSTDRLFVVPGSIPAALRGCRVLRDGRHVVTLEMLIDTPTGHRLELFVLDGVEVRASSRCLRQNGVRAHSFVEFEFDDPIGPESHFRFQSEGTAVVEEDRVEVMSFAAPTDHRDLKRRIHQTLPDWVDESIGEVVVSVRSDQFHDPRCRAAKTMAASNARKFKSPQAALEGGYDPHIDCLFRLKR